MKTSNYWVERALREANLTHSIDELNRELQRCYLKSYNRVERELKRLYLEIMEAEGTVQISHLYQYNRYYKILNLINKESIKLGRQQQVLFDKELTGVYNYNRKLLKNDWNILLNEAAVQEAIRVDWKGSNWSNRIWNNTAQLAEKVRENLIDAFATGSGTEQFTRNLMNDFSASYNNAHRLANTELAHCSTHATLDGYVDMGVTKYKVITEKDCCDVCSDLANQIFDITDDSGLVPDNSHPNCRCSIVAVV